MFHDLILCMASSGNIPNLSIIAVRILPHCRDYIRKCLKENTYYYLNTNFDISEDVNTITLQEKYLDVINDTFFNQDEIFDENVEKLKSLADSIHDRSKPNISISAVVGKNGDGKSSFVELIIRILNNFAYRKGLNANDHLRYVEGVYGELYYRLNGKFYRIQIRKEQENVDNVEFHEYAYDENEKIYRIGNSLTEFNPDETAFYTLVSNYSHFAYNTEEFSEESISDDVEDHWLHKLFHKNDAYQTPLNLHPYRNKGNIDINRERSLSTQRLLASIASSLTKNNKGVYEPKMEINDKKPHEIRLRDIGESKLQEITLKKYFEDNRENRYMEDQIEKLKKVESSGISHDTNEVFIGDVAATTLSSLRRDYLTDKLKEYLRKAIAWLDTNDLLMENSDLDRLLDVLSRIDQDGWWPVQLISKKDMEILREFSRLSVKQFFRLALVYDICNMWNVIGVGVDKQMLIDFDAVNIFRKYDSLSYPEKCGHYIIYKTIEIFATYPSYGDPIALYSSPDTIFSLIGVDLSVNTLFDLMPAFFKLSRDWYYKSHNTLKLRQAYNLMTGNSEAIELYAPNREKSEKRLRFSELEADQIKILSDIETLPPPIFKWEIWYDKKFEGSLIPFSSFSSGEKQLLFFQSAIIYHLQNISSVGNEPIHYHAVNLIFEEIELYFHPEWQRTLIFDLMKSIRTANIPRIRSVNMIFVTHSPYILSDIPKSNVLFLKDGRPIYEMQENTFGANINSLLKNGFFLPSLPMGEFAYRKINKLFEKLHSGDFNPKDIDQVYAQIMTIGEPAIRLQLMTLFAPYNILRRTDDDTIEKLRKFLSESPS